MTTRINQIKQPAQHRSMEDTRKVDLTPYKAWFMHVAHKETGGRFIVDETNREIVNDLFLYFHKLPGKLDSRKGIWLEGHIGTGKSTLLNVFSAYMQSLKIGFKVYICSHVTTLYSIDGNLDLFLENRNGLNHGPVDMGFDELGREPNPASYYGNKMNVFEHILHIRYHYWQTQGVKTFISTNMDAKQLGEKYGDYIRDRRKEMFNIIPVTGKSRR